MMENRKAPRYVPAAVALTMAAAILIVACTAPSPMETDDAVAPEQAPNAVASILVKKLQDGNTWITHEEGAEGNEIVDLQFGEDLDFVFKSDDGTLHLSENGELREISKLELARRFGEDMDGNLELTGESDTDGGTWTLDRIESGHLEFAPDTESPNGDWTIDETQAVRLKLIKEQHRDEDLHEKK